MKTMTSQVHNEIHQNTIPHGHHLLGGFRICPWPLILVYTQSRVGLEIRPRYFR